MNNVICVYAREMTLIMGFTDLDGFTRKYLPIFSIMSVLPAGTQPDHGESCSAGA